jgi:hypothetical protein
VARTPKPSGEPDRKDRWPRPKPHEHGVATWWLGSAVGAWGPRPRPEQARAEFRRLVALWDGRLPVEETLMRLYEHGAVADERRYRPDEPKPFTPRSSGPVGSSSTTRSAGAT